MIFREYQTEDTDVETFESIEDSLKATITRRHGKKHMLVRCFDTQEGQQVHFAEFADYFAARLHAKCFVLSINPVLLARLEKERNEKRVSG